MPSRTNQADLLWPRNGLLTDSRMPVSLAILQCPNNLIYSGDWSKLFVETSLGASSQRVNWREQHRNQPKKSLVERWMLFQERATTRWPSLHDIAAPRFADER